jgi:hypothetical protein
VIIISELIKHARNVAAASKKDGFIGGRIPKGLEIRFKEYIGDLGLSQAEALQILIEKELGSQETGVSGPAASYELDNNKLLAAAPAKPLPENKTIKSKTGKNKGSKRGAYDKYKREDVNGAVMFPCPVCAKWVQFSTFKNRHTKTHGYADHLDMFQDHQEVTQNMLNDWPK